MRRTFPAVYLHTISQTLSFVKSLDLLHRRVQPKLSFLKVCCYFRASPGKIARLGLGQLISRCAPHFQGRWNSLNLCVLREEDWLLQMRSLFLNPKSLTSMHR